MTIVRNNPLDTVAPPDGAPVAHAPVPASGPRPGRVASDKAGSVGRDAVDLVLPWLVAAVTLVARLATAASGPTDWDSSQFAAAVSRFDVTHGRPQPPGYFLYVVAGRLVHTLGPGTVTALVIVSAIASAAAAGLVVVAGRDLGGRWVGACAGLLVATSPFAWFSGSVVNTYSFDLLIAPLLIILAWRARPHSWHGAAALGALGLAAGFRQSSVQTFALLALLAVLGSVRRVREGVLAVLVGVGALAAWFVPMSLSQPGGVAAWAQSTRAEAEGAARATSVLDHASGAGTNFGTFAGYTTVALAPLAALAAAAALLLGLRWLVRSISGVRGRNGGARDGSTPVVLTVSAPPSGRPPTHGLRRGRPDWVRPWYQSRTAILLAAIVPPVAVVGLVQFAKGGYLLAYLPGAVIALLLVPAALLRGRSTTADPTPTGSVRGAGIWTGSWLAIASLAVAAIAVLGAQRFLVGTGVLPLHASQSAGGAWITQARYQAPYADTRAAIRAADAVDDSVARLAPLVHPGRDVVVIDTVDGGASFYRNAGWALPLDRVALLAPGVVVYNEQAGSLFYARQSTVRVGRAGVVYLIAPPFLPGLAPLAGAGKAVEVKGGPHIDGYRVWRITPGSTLLGTPVVATAGVRPLGSGING